MSRRSNTEKGFAIGKRPYGKATFPYDIRSKPSIYRNNVENGEREDFFNFCKTANISHDLKSNSAYSQGEQLLEIHR